MAAPANATCGEHALALAVLDNGIRCYRRCARGRTEKAQREFYDAYEWIYSPDTDWPFSFVNLCNMLGIDPARLRNVIAKPDADWKRIVGH